MKILVVNCVFDPEPIVSAQIGKALADKLEQLKHNITVISPYPSRPNGFQFEKNFEKKRDITEFIHSPYLKLVKLPSFVFPKSNPLGRLWEGISFGWHCYKYIINNSNTIERVYMNTWPLFGQLFVALACKKCNLRYVVHIQDIYPESLANKFPSYVSFFFMKILLPIDKYVISNALKIIVVSDYMKIKIISRGNIFEEKISVVYNWQDENIFEKETFNISYKDSLTFMYLGNIGPVADIPGLIKSFFESNINAKLIIAGSGSKKIECENIVKSFGIRTVEFLDVPTGAVPKTQAKADVLILPTIKNGAKSSIPSKLAGYMLSRKPILAIVDNDTDTYNSIIESNCGWAVDPSKRADIVKQFQLIMQMDKSELIKMGEDGYCYAKTKFSQEVNLNKLLEIIVN